MQLERAREGKNEHLNMVVPIDLLKPILDDLRKFGRVNKPARPWLGVYSTEIEDKVVIVGIAGKGPAARAEIKTGDVVLSVAGQNVSTLGGFYRKVWSLGAAGVEVPLTLYREGVTFDVRVNSSDRAKFLKAPADALRCRPLAAPRARHTGTQCYDPTCEGAFKHETNDYSGARLRCAGCRAGFGVAGERDRQAWHRKACAGRHQEDGSVEHDQRRLRLALAAQIVPAVGICESGQLCQDDGRE